MNVAVILAGGSGKRAGTDKPKQFCLLGGKLVIEYAVEVFEHHKDIDEIAVVVHPGYVSEIERLISKNKWTKVRKILKGGRERSDSTLAALSIYTEPDVKLIFHDAVRPLLSPDIIGEVIDALRHSNAVDVAIPSTDTIVQVEEGRIVAIPDRSQMWRSQTPQAFKQWLIRQAYDRATADPDFKATDDCGVVKKYLPEERIVVVRGEEKNMKLTYKEDMDVLERFLVYKS